MNQHIAKFTRKPWQKWLSASASAFVGSVLLMSASAEAQTNISPPADPFNYTMCLPTILPPSATGTVQLNSFLSGQLAINPHDSKDLVALIGLDAIKLTGYFNTAP